MLDFGIDEERLSALVSAALGRACRLSPLKVPSTHPIFRGETDGAPFFVKVSSPEAWRRTSQLLKDIAGCALVPRLLVDSAVSYDHHAVTIMEWRDAKLVFPEDMTDRQIESFAAGCQVLSQWLQKTQSYFPLAGTSLEPERLYAVVANYARRHPVAGYLLRELTSLPVERRTFGRRPLSVLHGDFHAKNFGFSEDAFTFVVDFDNATQGLACGDLVNALGERFSSLSLSVSARARLKRVAQRVISATPWSREELEICCNVLRLRFAARRILKHPGAAWVALDILRRDRKIREFLRALD